MRRGKLQSKSSKTVSNNGAVSEITVNNAMSNKVISNNDNAINHSELDMENNDEDEIEEIAESDKNEFESEVPKKKRLSYQEFFRYGEDKDEEKI